MASVTSSRRILFVAANASIDRLHEVDRLVAGAIHRPDRVLALPGGKGLNAARAAVSLGADVVVVAIVGGRAGEWIADRLTALGIPASLVRTAAETRTCLSVLDRSVGTLTEFYEPGEAIASGAWPALEAAIGTEIATGDLGALTLSGSLPPAAPVDGYARIVRMAAERGISVLVDAHGPALDLAITAAPSVVKVNAAEAGAAAGIVAASDEDVLRAARWIVERGVGAAVVTLGGAGAGGAGAIVVDGAGAWRLTGPTTRGAYPVGSGDAFLAGLAAGIVRGMDLVEAARNGLAAGFANAQRPGAGELDPDVARDVLEQVVAQPI